MAQFMVEDRGPATMGYAEYMMTLHKGVLTK